MVETEKTRERKQDKSLGGIGIERKRKGERESKKGEIRRERVLERIRHND